MNPRPWALSVDYGTSNTVAAIAEPGRTPRIMQFSGSASLPSGVYLEAGQLGDPWLVGRPAERAALVEPGNFEATPKRSIPMGSVYLAEREVPVSDLISATLQAVFREAWRQQDNTPPVLILLTHPADWPATNLETLLRAARAALPAGGMGIRLMTVPEPVAAAWHAANSRNVPQRARIAVLDLGGGTCDVAVVDRDERSFRLAARPLGVDPLGGEDFDVRLLELVLRDIDQSDLHARLLNGTRADLAAYLDLRRSCREAKEQLSNQVRAHVRVPAVKDALPDGASVQVSRPHQLEPLLLAEGAERPGLDTAADLTVTALQEAPRTQAPVFVFLVGGSSRIPLLGQLVQSRTGLNPLEHGDPGTAVAEGGASIANDALAGLPVPAVEAGVSTPSGQAQGYHGVGPTHDAHFNPNLGAQGMAPDPRRPPQPQPGPQFAGNLGGPGPIPPVPNTHGPQGVFGPAPQTGPGQGRHPGHPGHPPQPPVGPGPQGGFGPVPGRQPGIPEHHRQLTNGRGGSKPKTGLILGIIGGVTALLLVGVLGIAALRGGGTPTTTGPVTDDPPPGDYSCWDGSMAADVNACPVLEGDAALGYVFNSDGDLTCKPYTGTGTGTGETATLECTLPGNSAQIFLSQWDQASAAQRYYTKQYKKEGEPGTIDSEESVLVWRIDTKDPNGTVRVAWAYRNFPFSMEVVAATTELRDAADDAIAIQTAADLEKAGPLPAA